MRGNSSKDEARNNLHDPTLRDRDLARGRDCDRGEETEGARRSPDRPQGLGHRLIMSQPDPD